MHTTVFPLPARLAVAALAALAAGRAPVPAGPPVEAPLTTRWAAAVDPAHPLPEYPRPQLVRERWLSLNGPWQFQFAEAGEALPGEQPLRREILVPYPWESALSGIREQAPGRRAWYRRRFEVPSGWGGSRVLLHFGAVDWEARVFVNGAFVGQHRGGYDAFTFDITDCLRVGGGQELVVGVWDPGSDEPIARGKQQNDKFADPGRFHYTPSSGIWQTVWLEPVPDRYIRDLHLVPDIDRETLTVRVRLSDTGDGAPLRVTARAGDRVVARAEGPQRSDLVLALPGARRWSPDDPFLYDLEVERVADGRPGDRVTGYFGMRGVSLARDADGVQRILLNGAFLFQMGPLDQGYWPDGLYTAPTDEALRWDVEQIKAAGYNMVRKHVKVEPARWYAHCDRVGLLVWQDMPHAFGDRDEEQKAQFEWELRRMVTGRWNHPSVITWVVFNEHWGLYDVMRITPEIMALDPTRLVIGNSGYTAGPKWDWEVGHLKDVHIYRAPGTPVLSANRAIVLGEYGAIGYCLDGHVWDPDGPWVHYNYAGRDAATAEYETFIGTLRGFIRGKGQGLCAAVYTQWTDVENEMNGIYTYDRKVPKLDLDRVREANRSTWAAD